MKGRIPVAKSYTSKGDASGILPCGCPGRGSDRVCKHYYANVRSALTQAASGTDCGDGDVPRSTDREVVQPGGPQPAPTFFHFPSVEGAPTRLVTPTVRGESWDHTVFLRSEYRWYLRQWRRIRRANR